MVTNLNIFHAHSLTGSKKFEFPGIYQLLQSDLKSTMASELPQAACVHQRSMTASVCTVTNASSRCGNATTASAGSALSPHLSAVHSSDIVEGGHDQDDANTAFEKTELLDSVEGDATLASDRTQSTGDEAMETDKKVERDLCIQTSSSCTNKSVSDVDQSCDSGINDKKKLMS